MDDRMKKKGVRDWFRRHKPTKRRLIQVYAALLYNANVKGFATGKIYTGVTKNLCVPGLNCYSCPGAVGACPLGSLQNALASSKTSSLAYVFGIFILFGLLLGRTICGFLCPFGLIQELLHKIPSPKLKKSRVTRVLSYFKYVILVAMAVMIPLAFSDKLAVPGFCKYICPDGILLGAIGLLLHPDNAEMFGMLGPLFTWKMCLLILFLVSSIFIFRPFCRFFCPLGGIYGFFCRVAMLGVKLDRDTCIHCGLCITTCKMDTRRVGDHECIHCGQCIPVCPTKAIHWSGSKYMISDPTGGLAENGPADQGAASSKGPESRKPGRRRMIIRITAAVLALAVLGGAIWYYNFRDDSTDDPRPTESETETELGSGISGETEPETDIETETDTDIVKEYGYQVGSYCPDFTVSVIGSEEQFALSEQHGKIVVVNFWATWCGPCVNEIPHFIRLAQEFSEDVAVVAIATDSPTSDYLAKKGWDSATFALDAAGACGDETVFNTIGRSDAMPVTVVLDREGKIIFRRIGSVDYDTLLAAIAPALS